MIRQAAPQIVLDNYGEDDVDPRLQAEEIRLGNVIGAKLVDTYPGHWWRVDVPHRQGVIKIMLPHFTGKVWGYIIPYDKLDPGFKTVVRGGGDLLERFGISRSGFNEAQLSDALDIYGKTPPSIANGFELGDRPVRRVSNVRRDWNQLIEGMRHGE